MQTVRSKVRPTRSCACVRTPGVAGSISGEWARLICSVRQCDGPPVAPDRRVAVTASRRASDRTPMGRRDLTEAMESRIRAAAVLMAVSSSEPTCGTSSGIDSSGGRRTSAPYAALDPSARSPLKSNASNGTLPKRRMAFSIWPASCVLNGINSATGRFVPGNDEALPCPIPLQVRYEVHRGHPCSSPGMEQGVCSPSPAAAGEARARLPGAGGSVRHSDQQPVSDLFFMGGRTGRRWRDYRLPPSPPGGRGPYRVPPSGGFRRVGLRLIRARCCWRSF